MVATDVASRGIGMIDHDSSLFPFPSPQLTSCGCEEVVLSSLHPHCALQGSGIATFLLVPVWPSLSCNHAQAIVSLENPWLFSSAARLKVLALSLTYSLFEAYFRLLRVTSRVQRRKFLFKGFKLDFIAARR